MPLNQQNGLNAGFQIANLLNQGQSASAMANQNAQVDYNNAAQGLEEARNRAVLIRQQGERDAKSSKASSAASGFVSSEGTDLTLQLETLKIANLNAMEETRVARVNETRLNQSAAHSIQRGKVARRSSVLNAATAGINILS